MDLILGLLVYIGVGAILIYAMAWFIYKHIIKPDFDKYREEQNQRHKEITRLLQMVIVSGKAHNTTDTDNTV